jgi:hypothetical protein
MEKNKRAHEQGFENEWNAAIGRFKTRKIIRRIVLLALVSTIWLFVIFCHRSETLSIEDILRDYLARNSAEQIRLEISQWEALEAGLLQCVNIKQRPVSVSDSTRKNPRADLSAKPILIKNATLIDGDGLVWKGYSILLSEGLIAKVATGLDPPADAKIIDVGGRYVSPGLVDMVFMVLLS